MQLHSIIYTSIATHVLSKAELEHILVSARERNVENNITGVLLYADGRFMQYLEGPMPGLLAVLAHIDHAKQHHDLAMGEIKPIEVREYEAWSMAYVTADDGTLAPGLSRQTLNQFLRPQ